MQFNKEEKMTLLNLVIHYNKVNEKDVPKTNLRKMLLELF